MSGSSLRLRQSIIVLVVCYALALLLGISDLTGLYNVIWADLDTQIFRGLNDMVTPDAAISQFWALTNSKTFDRAVFIVMLGIVIYLIMSTKREDRIEATAKVGAIIFLILVSLLISKKIIGDDFYHPSPGYLLTPYNDVNDFISGYTVKTATDNSFPGDHAMTSAVFAGGIILLFSRPYVATLSILLMIFVSLPRLAAGGHWFTDVLIGSGAACLFLLPWLKISPMVSWIETLLTWIWTRAPASLRR